LLRSYNNVHNACMRRTYDCSHKIQNVVMEKCLLQALTQIRLSFSKRTFAVSLGSSTQTATEHIVFPNQFHP